MTILSLSRFMLAGVLLASFNASAIPGFWQQGYGQGLNTEMQRDRPAERRFHQLLGTRTRMVSISIQSFSYPPSDKMVSSHDDDPYHRSGSPAMHYSVQHRLA